ncbi:glycosyltransferase family 2 protein [Thioalkalivibrio thiocyanodenitrificans]|uniref:glycosyltransferase family 2 protein n=1 Tax=Thioalkalivibrio thiocyanodenitrificans TaxID=243063 RepID=UPI000373A68E|nr:glycosyltransferase family A protein [Thioalkalivibrio thiocyanodenitrificans]
MKVSVIIPTYNRADYLVDAIDSVLNQTVPVDEIIVIDDGSTDHTAASLRGYSRSVRLLRQDRAGAGAARNRGVHEARGELIAFLDSDDLWTPVKMELQLAAMAAHPGVDIVFGHAEQFISSDVPAADAARLHCPNEPVPGYVFGSMLLPRPVFQRVGPIATAWRVGEFIDWYDRARALGLHIHMLEATLLRRRVHGPDQMAATREVYGDYARVLKAALDRRRQAGRTGSA